MVRSEGKLGVATSHDPRTPTASDTSRRTTLIAGHHRSALRQPRGCFGRILKRTFHLQVPTYEEPLGTRAAGHS